MNTKNLFRGVVASLAAGIVSVHAQYPSLSGSVQAEAARRKAESDRRSDEAFQNATAAIKEWERKGRPYLPGAARPGDLPQAKIPAFPGAWGGGMYAFGGRGGKVFVVNNLNDRGPGSFREALEAGGPRVVVFNVAGIIRLKERIRVRAPYITIAGNTAPGDGVCIAGDTVELETHDVVIRHLRFRRGETWVGDRNDSLGGNPVGNIMIDHVSASWGLDENMSMYRHMYQPPGGGQALKLPTVNITIQNSIFSEALNTYNHAFGSTIGGLNSTFYRNLWACNSGRNPSVGMTGDFTFANNVIFNWRHRTVDGGDHRSYYTITSNYFKPGPVTPKDQPIAYRVLKPESQRSKEVVDNFGKAFVAGNVVEGNARVTADNWDGGVQPETVGSLDAALKSIRTNSPYAHAPLDLKPAAQAYEDVLANSGATLPRRDAVDERIVRTVRTGNVTAKPGADIQDRLGSAGYSRQTIDAIVSMVDGGLITHPDEVGGYPTYAGTPYQDSDFDGMPDDWETKNGLNPRDAADAAKDLNGDGYTNIEDFINGLDPRGQKVDWTDLRNNVDPRQAS
ncbi:MAG TPA: polysaccharide lyase [Verrucomicrobiae bacterium]|nr:polysaccharide lyase [Verrucomicrobiae bacterium]